MDLIDGLVSMGVDASLGWIKANINQNAQINWDEAYIYWKA